MSNRKILPLALIKANNEQPVEGRTRLQKMIFLAQKRLEDSKILDEEYEYFPYNYGPFSKELYGDIDKLVEDGIIEEREETEEENKKKYYYELTSKGQKLLKDELQGEGFDTLEDVIEEIKSQYNEMNLPDLLDEIYSKYPNYAEKSTL